MGDRRVPALDEVPGLLRAHRRLGRRVPERSLEAEFADLLVGNGCSQIVVRGCCSVREILTRPQAIGGAFSFLLRGLALSSWQICTSNWNPVLSPLSSRPSALACFEPERIAESQH